MSAYHSPPPDAFASSRRAPGKAEQVETTRRVWEAAERRLVQALFQRAFEHDPHFAWLVPPGADRPARLRHLLEHLVSARSPEHGEIHVTDDLHAAAIWFPPPGGRERLRERLGHLPALAFACGWPRLPMRVLELRRIAALRPRAPHCYLQMLAVDPSHQRRGLGSTLLGTLLRQADEACLPVCLETGNAANLTFYARHGFAIHQVSHLSEGLTLWTVLRPARTAAS